MPPPPLIGCRRYTYVFVCCFSAFFFLLFFCVVAAHPHSPPSNLEALPAEFCLLPTHTHQSHDGKGIHFFSSGRKYFSEERSSQDAIRSFRIRRPVGRIHGSNPWVEIQNLAGQGDPTRDMTCISRVVRLLAGRVGSGHKILNSHGSGRVRRPMNFYGWVRLGQEVLKSYRLGRVRFRGP